MIICSYQDNEIQIIWDKVPSADGYKLYRKTADHVYTSFKEVKTNTVTLFGMLNAEIKIKPYKLINGKQEFIFNNEKIILDNSDAVDEFETLINTSKTSCNIFWKPIKNADQYKIFINDNFITETANNRFVTNLLPFGISEFIIEAYKNNKLLKKSPVLHVDIKSMELFAFNQNGKVFLYWNKVPNIDGYRIFKKNNKNVFDGFQTSENENAYVENISPGEIAEYKVKPFILKDNKRNYSTELSAKCKVTVYETSKIELLLNEAYDNKLSASWHFNGDVDGFELYCDGKLLKNIPDGLAHITLVDYVNGVFQIKGYKKYFDKIIYTCESDKISNLAHRLSLPTPENYKVSVIIPAYNSQDYISRTICTVLSSTLDNIELIIVDDESSDNTRDVLNWYQNKYPNYIKTIFKKNGGVAHTRNVGIAQAQGEFIAFMDNDDMIRPNGFKLLYDAITATNSDIVVSPIYRIDNDKYITRHKLPFKNNIAYNIEDYLRLIFSDGFNNIGVWNKLYRTDIVKAHPFGLLAYEDVSWTPYILSYAEKFCYIDDICYEWDRKIRTATFSNVLSNRTAEEKFKERFEALEFFYKGGNQKRKECLAYIMAKRLLGQGKSAKYSKYFEAISNMKNVLINNKFLLSDKKACEEILPLLQN